MAAAGLIGLSMMEYFAALRSRIASDWENAGFDREPFPAIAAEALSSMRPCDHIDYHEILEWSIGEHEWLEGLAAGDGRAPLCITVAADPRFVIEAQYYTTPDPAVREHRAPGAFAILEGSSLYARYRFDDVQQVHPHMLRGRLAIAGVDLLDEGGVEPTIAGVDRITADCHFGVPSTVIVVRAVPESDRPGYTFYTPHLALNAAVDDRAMQQERIVRLLTTLDLATVEQMTTRVFERADLLATYVMLEHLYRGYRRAFKDLLAVATARHGQVVESFVPVFAELERQAPLLPCFEKTPRPDHRLFLALLLTVPSRPWIRSLVERHCPGVDVSAQLAQWTIDVSGRLFGAEFDDADRHILAALLDGCTIPQVLSRLEQAYSAEEVAQQRDQLVAHCSNMQQSALRPLFADVAPVAEVHSHA